MISYYISWTYFKNGDTCYGGMYHEEYHCINTYDRYAEMRDEVRLLVPDEAKDSFIITSINKLN